MISHQFKREFFETLSILKDYLSDIVIAGGWAPLIYYHYLLSDKSRVPLRTIDIDIIVPEHLKKRRDKTVDAILTEAGFKTCFKSRHTPPVRFHHYDLLYIFHPYSLLCSKNSAK